MSNRAVQELKRGARARAKEAATRQDLVDAYCQSVQGSYPSTANAIPPDVAAAEAAIALKKMEDFVASIATYRAGIDSINKSLEGVDEDGLPKTLLVNQAYTESLLKLTDKFIGAMESAQRVIARISQLRTSGYPPPGSTPTEPYNGPQSNF